MPYANSVRLRDTAGGPPVVPVVARLWGVSAEIQGANSTDAEQSGFALSTDASAQSQFAFAGPSPDPELEFQDQFYALAIQDATGVVVTDFDAVSPDNRGWLFRSGAFHLMLPGGLIDIIAGRHVLTPDELHTLVPLVPTDLPPVTATTTVDKQVPFLRGPWNAGPAGPAGPGGIEVEILTTTTIPNGDAHFSYSGRAIFGVSAEIAAPANEAIALVDFIDLGLRSEDPPDKANEIAAVLDEDALHDSLRDYMVETIVPRLRRDLEAKLAAEIAGAAGLAIGAGGLPAGVILSLRTLDAQDGHMELRGALGTFGTVASKLPRAKRPLPIPCPWSTVVSLGYVAGGLEILHALRDGTLAATELGRWATDAYYRCAGEVSALLERDPRLAARAAALAGEITEAVRVNGTLGDALGRRCEQLMHDIAAVGTPELRAAVAHGLDAGVTRLV